MTDAVKKLKELDSHMYYTLLDYKERYRKDFNETFTVDSVHELSKEGLALWMGFVIGKLINQSYKLANEI